jgi:hypothetical protein
MVLANMVCSWLCEELWFFFFFRVLTSCARKGGRRPVKNKINTSSGVRGMGREGKNVW